MNSLRNFHFWLRKIRFFSRGASPPEPPSKESKQTSDNIACFYNLISPIIKSVEIFNIILRLHTCIYKDVFRNIICEFVGTSGWSGGRSPPVAEGKKNWGVNNLPLNKENFQVVRGVIKRPCVFIFCFYLYKVGKCT